MWDVCFKCHAIKTTEAHPPLVVVLPPNDVMLFNGKYWLSFNEVLGSTVDGRNPAPPGMDETL